MPSKEITICGPQLNLTYVEFSLDSIKTKKELHEVLSEYIPEWDSGNSESGLLFPPVSAQDNDANELSINLKKDESLIPRPSPGKILFVSYYFYDEEVYKATLINNEPLTVKGQRFNDDYYFSQFFQGDHNLDADPIDVGEHNGDVSWQFMIHNKTISMGDIRGIRFESEDMNELVDNVYALYEAYLSLNNEIQIKSENRVVTEVRFLSLDSEMYDWLELEKKEETEESRKEFFVLKLNHFILTLKEESGNSIGDKILVSDNGKDFNELNQGLNSIDFEFYEDLKVYIPITNKTSGDDLNMLFLSSMKDYAIATKFPNNDELISQAYDCGEYDTGYYEPSAVLPDEGYICGNIDENGSFKSLSGWEEDIKTYSIAVEMLKK